MSQPYEAEISFAHKEMRRRAEELARDNPQKYQIRGGLFDKHLVARITSEESMPLHKWLRDGEGQKPT